MKTIALVIIVAGITPTAVAAGLSIRAVWQGGQPSDAVLWGGNALSNWVYCAAWVIEGTKPMIVWHGLLAAVCTYMWWRHRDRDGKGKKALKELGAKSRARIASLVEQMTPSPIQTPVRGSV